MQFTKMHGLGNDFVLLDILAGPLGYREEDWAPLAVEVCDRHFGIGADGLVLLLPGEDADVRMRIFNSDGSEAETCGNGIRCLARYFHDRYRPDSPEIRVQTEAGPAAIRVDEGGSVTVDMGAPIFDPERIPVATLGAGAVDLELPLPNGQAVHVDAVSMGNPHAVTFLQSGEVEPYLLDVVGPQVEHLPVFPKRTNFEVCEIIDPHRLRVRVWERGAGLTLACGTGACASVVAAQRRGLASSPVTVELPGGELTIQWDGRGSVLMTGPADYVFTGAYASKTDPHPNPVPRGARGQAAAMV
ncbi:MAG: diaminopimelate epimerase [Chloroflexi bacterium]|nr:diaminopimelate epimerase [Chloroflexota bacterium]